MKESKLLIILPLLILVPCVSATVSRPKAIASKHFVLVHEVCHGAWSWYKIVASLRSSGHNVTALDLGAAGINPKQVLETRRLSDYYNPLIEFIASLPTHEKVVLVGHGIGGLAISMAMESFPQKILVAVFVTALMPGITLNASTLSVQATSGVVFQPDNRVTYDDGPTKPPTTFTFGPTYLASNLYQLSPTQDLALATTLIRPVYIHTVDDITKEIVLSSKRYGSIRRVFIVAAEDKIIKKEFQEMMIQKNRPDEVEEIRGSDHMAMMSKPLHLFNLLLHIANK